MYASSLATKRVPSETACAPSTSAAARPRPSAIPPDASTGTGAIASTIAGTSTESAVVPITWPPASEPCAITASTPAATARFASSTDPTWTITVAPPATATIGVGSPQKRTRIGTPCSTAISAVARWSSWRIRLTPNGRSVSSRVRSIRGTRCLPRPVPPRTPQPPAFDTAATSSGPAPVPKPTEKTGASMPSRRQNGVVSMCLLSHGGSLRGTCDNSPVVPRLSLPALAASSAVLVTLALALVFFVAPTDADQGFSQRIFYFHVSIAFTAYLCFGLGAWKALVHLWKRDPAADLESYVAIHQGVIFGSLVLLTGSIWAKISWGHWWLWSENQLVLFLVLFLFYAAYFMLRFSVDPGPQRANLSAVYALFGVVLIPVSFFAIRLAQHFIHPVVFTRSGPAFGGWILATYLVAQAAVVVLAYTLYRLELSGKRLDLRLRELREAGA